MLADRVRMGYIKKGGIPSYYVMATDSDFSGTRNGSFKYIGSHTYVIIPHVIKGQGITSYQGMFQNNTSTILKGVASDNPNVTTMNAMFQGSAATSLDLSSFDTSRVTDMTYMFYGSSAIRLDLSSFDTSNVTKTDQMFNNSSATIVYARTQADIDKFNASYGKPSRLVFYIK